MKWLPKITVTDNLCSIEVHCISLYSLFENCSLLTKNWGAKLTDECDNIDVGIADVATCFDSVDTWLHLLFRSKLVGEGVFSPNSLLSFRLLRVLIHLETPSMLFHNVILALLIVNNPHDLLTNTVLSFIDDVKIIPASPNSQVSGNSLNLVMHCTQQWNVAMNSTRVNTKCIFLKSACA